MRNKETIKKELRSLVKRVKSGAFSNRDMVDFGRITKTHADKIKRNTGIKVHGYRRVIFASEVKHIIRKHGRGNEKQKNQIGVTTTDLISLPDLFSGVSSIRLEKTKDGLRAIKHVRNSKNNIFIVEVVRTGRKQLAIKTMYKKRK